MCNTHCVFCVVRYETVLTNYMCMHRGDSNSMFKNSHIAYRYTYPIVESNNENYIICRKSPSEQMPVVFHAFLFNFHELLGYRFILLYFVSFCFVLYSNARINIFHISLFNLIVVFDVK